MLNEDFMDSVLDAAIRGDIMVEGVEIVPPAAKGPAAGSRGMIKLKVKPTSWFKDIGAGEYILRQTGYERNAKSGSIDTVWTWKRWEEALDVLPALTPEKQEAWEQSHPCVLLREQCPTAKWLRTILGKLVPRNRAAREEAARRGDTLFKTFRPWA